MKCKRAYALVANGPVLISGNEAEVLRGVTAIAPELIREQEKIRYERQEGLVKLLEEKGAMRTGLSAAMARDILWMLTSYDIHRRLVVERKWSADEYEKWLGDTFVATLLGAEKGREP